MGEFVVGIIGMGDMGRLYAKRLSRGGWKVHACDREQNFSQLQKDLAGEAGIVVLRNGHEVARTSDYILYNVEASSIESVVRDYGKSTKPGAIVGGQTSCKAPETKAFECHLPQHCEIVSLHSLHGPFTNPHGQPLAIIPHRASPESVSKVQEIVACLESKTKLMTAAEHDSITANTQVLMSTIFMSIVLAFKFHGRLPSTYHAASTEKKYKKKEEEEEEEGNNHHLHDNGGKNQMHDLYTLVFRIFNQKWHVYAGLSLFNPFSETHLAHYASSVRTLTALVVEGRREELRDRVRSTAGALRERRAAVVVMMGPPPSPPPPPPPLLLQLPLILSIAIMATGDMWVAMNINPWEHLHCATPQYRQWLDFVSDLYSAFGLATTTTTTTTMTMTTLDASLSALFSVADAHQHQHQHLARAVETWLSFVRAQDFAAFGHTFEDTGCWLSGQSSSSLAMVIGSGNDVDDETGRPRSDRRSRL